MLQLAATAVICQEGMSTAVQLYCPLQLPDLAAAGLCLYSLPDTAPPSTDTADNMNLGHGTLLHGLLRHARFALLSSAENRGLPRTPGGTKLPPVQG
jgi:hypothetical protein